MPVKGQGGVKPLEAEESPRDKAFGEAADQLGPDEVESKGKKESEPEFAQATLPGVPAETPKVIRNGKMLAKFVQAILDRDKDGEPLLKFEFSFPLTAEHEEHLPDGIVEGWKVVRRGHCDLYRCSDIPPLNVTIALVPDDKDALKLTAASIEKPTLQVIKDIGTGKSKTGIRLSFRAVVGRDDDSTKFAVTYDGNDVWIRLREPQAKLKY